MINLVWKDLLLLKRSLWLAPLYAFFAFFAFRTMPDGGLSAATVAISYMLLLQAIIQDDKNQSEIMLNSLPMRRGNIVLAKYLSAFLYATLGILSFLLTQVIVTVVGIPLSINQISFEEIFGALIAMVVLIGIYFPIYFKFGYLRSRIVGTILLVVSIFLFAMGLSLAQRAGGVNNSILQTIITPLQGVVGWLQTQTDWQIASYLFALALIFTASSALLSLRFYTRREF
ncbi:MAG TPA: ABC-2 transporter permease [Desulfosporosinus sp.]|nr:ABC-2 transporter permease [Desulfosporosinus sp.]